MKIGLAQLRPKKGDIDENIKRHTSYIKLAIANKLNAIFFSELSITGYQPELAAQLKTSLNSPLFAPFQTLSARGSITIGVGAPTPTNEAIQISLLIFQHGKARQQYSKQLLHEDELPYFVPGDRQVLLELEALKIAPAICYESLQKVHFDQAISMGANLYLASVAKDQKGIDKAMAYFSSIAKVQSTPILMANCIGNCDHFKSAGQSAVWDKTGTLIGQLTEVEEGILVYNIENNSTYTLSIQNK